MSTSLAPVASLPPFKPVPLECFESDNGETKPEENTDSTEQVEKTKETGPTRPLGTRKAGGLPPPPKDTGDEAYSIGEDGQWQSGKTKNRRWWHRFNPFRFMKDLMTKVEYVPVGKTCLSSEQIQKLHKKHSSDFVKGIIACSIPKECSLLKGKLECPIKFIRTYRDWSEKCTAAKKAGLDMPDIKKAAGMEDAGLIEITKLRLNKWFHAAQKVMGLHPNQKHMQRYLNDDFQWYNMDSHYGTKYLVDRAGLWYEIDGENYPFDPGDSKKNIPDRYLGIDGKWRHVDDESGLRDKAPQGKRWKFKKRVDYRPSSDGAAPTEVAKLTPRDKANMTDTEAEKKISDLELQVKQLTAMLLNQMNNKK